VGGFPGVGGQGELFLIVGPASVVVQAIDGHAPHIALRCEHLVDQGAGLHRGVSAPVLHIVRLGPDLDVEHLSRHRDLDLDWYLNLNLDWDLDFLLDLDGHGDDLWLRRAACQHQAHQSHNGQDRP